MKIFLDTNIFYNDWFIKNANFKYLFHFINNEDYELIISELVIQEVENKRNQEFNNNINDLEKSIKNINKLNLINIEHMTDEISSESYNLLSLLKEKCDNINLVNYENISQKEVVLRALMDKKPFQKGEKGYRDTLIWLSFLEYLKLNTVREDVIFITANKSDFFRSKSSDLEFYQELLNDMRERDIKCAVKPFASLYSFVKSTIDKDEHAIDYNNSNIEYYLEEESISILNEFSENSIIDQLENVDYLNINRLEYPSIESISIELLEGLEDVKINGSKNLQNNETYIEYEYNLRRVSIDITLNKFEYKEKFNYRNKDNYCLSEDGSNTYMNVVVRVYFISSLIYNSETREISDFAINSLYFK